LLTHPFYTKWVAGTLPRECLQEYARQYHAFESSFPTFLSAIHSRTEDRGVRQALLENLWDEEHGEANHRELWLRFAEGVGGGRGRGACRLTVRRRDEKVPPPRVNSMSAPPPEPHSSPAYTVIRPETPTGWVGVVSRDVYTFGDPSRTGRRSGRRLR